MADDHVDLNGPKDNAPCTSVATAFLQDAPTIEQTEFVLCGDGVMRPQGVTVGTCPELYEAIEGMWLHPVNENLIGVTAGPNMDTARYGELPFKLHDVVVRGGGKPGCCILHKGTVLAKQWCSHYKQYCYKIDFDSNSPPGLKRLNDCWFPETILRRECPIKRPLLNALFTPDSCKMRRGKMPGKNRVFRSNGWKLKYLLEMKPYQCILINDAPYVILRNDVDQGAVLVCRLDRDSRLIEELKRPWGGTFFVEYKAALVNYESIDKWSDLFDWYHDLYCQLSNQHCNTNFNVPGIRLKPQVETATGDSAPPSDEIAGVENSESYPKESVVDKQNLSDEDLPTLPNTKTKLVTSKEKPKMAEGVTCEKNDQDSAGNTSVASKPVETVKPIDTGDQSVIDLNSPEHVPIVHNNPFRGAFGTSGVNLRPPANDDELIEEDDDPLLDEVLKNRKFIQKYEKVYSGIQKGMRDAVNKLKEITAAHQPEQAISSKAEPTRKRIKMEQGVSGHSHKDVYGKSATVSANRMERARLLKSTNDVLYPPEGNPLCKQYFDYENDEMFDKDAFLNYCNTFCDRSNHLSLVKPERRMKIAAHMFYAGVNLDKYFELDAEIQASDILSRLKTVKALSTNPQQASGSGASASSREVGKSTLNLLK